jgi:hypothetical protein
MKAQRTTPARLRLLHGSSDPLVETLSLSAGPLDLEFEPSTAFVRWVRLADRLILLGVYGAVRDRNWGTVAPRVTLGKLARGKNDFDLSFQVDCRREEIDFRWQGRLRGESNGSLLFDFQGEARSTFLRNRIGICVLHPAEAAGAACAVEHVDGAVERSRLPREISAQQPFLAIRALTHEVAPGVRAVVTLEGDTFEMEDQRNWTDASYKTYSTPLELPFPAEVRAGDRVHQSLHLRLESRSRSARPASARRRTLRPPATTIAPMRGSAPRRRMPEIGLGVPIDGVPASEQEIGLLRDVGLRHLRVDIRLRDDRWRDALDTACADAQAIGVPLEVALFLAPYRSRDLAAVADGVRAADASVARWIVLADGAKTTPPDALPATRRALEAVSPRAAFGGGTDHYFAELNRGRPAPELIDFVAWSLNPQVHAFDDASIVEALAPQAETVANARRLCPGRLLAVTPVTLRPRHNPNATGPAPPPAPGELPFEVDPRQTSLLGAAWTLGSLKHLAESGADTVTYFETTGDRGIVPRTKGGGALSAPRGKVYPLYHVLADAGELRGLQVTPSRSSAPLRVQAIYVGGPAKKKAGRRDVVLIAELSGRGGDARVALPAGIRKARVRMLDEFCVRAALSSPRSYRTGEWERIPVRRGEMKVALQPFAVARVELEA